MTHAVSVLDEIRRHQKRRAQGVPTVTSLVGPTGLCVRAWRGWASDERRPCAVAAEMNPRAFLPTWAEGAFAFARPEERARAWVAATSRRAIEAATAEVERMTRYDLEILRRSLPTDPDGPGATAAFLILDNHAAGTILDPNCFVHELAGDPGTAGGASRVILAITELYPPELWPALLLIPPDSAGEEWGWAAVRALEQMATAESRVSIAIALTADGYDRIITQHPGARTAALLQEGFVEVRGVSGNQMEQRLQAAGIELWPATVECLTANGLAEEVAEAFVRVSQSVQNPTPADVASDFRSVHEEFLYELLESMPQTVGLFRPNCPLAFRHGHQVAEGDLVAESLKLAVEIDGGFYHLVPDQYRRDRRKDWLYQRHGYLILRFLAEDVVSELESVLDTILEAVAMRRASAQPTGAA